MNQLPLAIESKDLLGLLLLVVGVAATTLLMLVRSEFRRIAIFLMVAGLPVSGWVDLDIYSAYWYRGTTRGFEVTAFDVLALGVLFSALIAPREGDRRWYWPASLGVMLLYLGYCTGVTVTATPAIFGLFEISKLVRGIVFFLAAALTIRRDRDLVVLLLGLVVAVTCESALAIRERLFFDIYRPTGTMDHPNSLSMYFCMAGPILISAACAQLPGWVRWSCWTAALCATATMVLTLSRAGLPIFVVVAGGTFLWCASWRPTPGRIILGFFATIVVAGVVFKSWPLLMARYGQATLQEEYFDATGESRGYYFRQASVMLDDKPFGVGLNNWSYWVSKEYGKRVGMRYENYDDIVYAPASDLLPAYRFAAPAHNLGVLTVAEVGWIGLGLLLLLWARWLTLGAGFLFSRRPEAMRRIGVGLCFGILGVFLHSFTEWTFRQTQIFLSFNLMAGVLASVVALKRTAKAEEKAAAAAAADSVDPWEAVRVPAGVSSVTHH